jgi:membrane-associated phospholipid phosphatase
MEPLYEIGISIILFFQNLGDWILPLMKFFTFLGDEQFYLLVTPVVYWCIDTTIGFRTALMLMFNSSIYTYGKWLFHTPRPAWYSSRINVYRAESSFGMPSGHSANSVGIWGILAVSFRKGWFWVLAITLMAAIGLSRIVLAVHFPHDVLTGWLFGLVVLLIFINLESRVLKWISPKPVRTKIMISFIVSLAMILIGLLALIPLNNWTLPVEWVANAALALPGEDPIDPTAFSGMITLAGTFFGLAAGHILLFAKNGYATRGTWWQQVLRYLVGVIGVFAIWYGLDILFPDGEALVPYLARYLRYGLVGFWITYLAPQLFIRLKIAQPSRP